MKRIIAAQQKDNIKNITDCTGLDERHITTPQKHIRILIKTNILLLFKGFLNLYEGKNINFDKNKEKNKTKKLLLIL